MSTFAEHLDHPLARGHTPADAFTGAAGGAACGDLIRLSLATDGRRITDAGFDASGCAAALAAASATVELAIGRGLLEAARLGAQDVSEALDGLSPAKRHAAELAADALHRALGAAVRERGALVPRPDRLLVAMSGGVDSAVAALLCARAGQTVGVTLELWSDPENDGELSCCSPQAVRAARALAHGMGLAHLSIDLRAEFRAGVVEPWLAEHAAGLTPNPCVRCNGGVRLEAMVALADRVGAAALATGHYARVKRGPHGPLLRRAADPAKDQSYMLAALAPATLERLRFPLGERSKPEVRALAADAALPVADKPDSQDLCFLAGTGRSAFLARHGRLGERPGAIVDRRGRTLGRHRGAHGFTVGQRRGLRVGGAGEALYVLATDADANTVTVGTREQLRTSTVSARDVTLYRPGAVIDGVKLRYRSAALACEPLSGLPSGTHERVELYLREPIHGAAPGQLACLLAGDVVVGHGTIDRSVAT
ncbi:MAG: tRNA 2-thiouridine(34) synthase MnmA [Actinobacteria bacterium]|nr:MAG: tRNA 2-thiouridine(34) synthase MnmA [Actinomycetota bacterium]